MIKKILNIASVLLIATTAYLWYQTSNVYVPKILYSYAIRVNNVVFHDDSDITMTIFLNDSNNIIKQSDSNTFQIMDESESNAKTLKLRNIQIGKRQKFEGEKYFPYHLTFENFSDKNNIYYPTAMLGVKNVKYDLKVQIGSFEYKVKENKVLNIDFEEYYGVYNKIDNTDTLVGVVASIINKSSTSYTFSALSGARIKIDSNKITEVSKVENETSVQDIIENYKLSLSKNQGTYTIAGGNKKKIFIPIAYNVLHYTTKIALELETKSGDGTYYMPNISLKSSLVQLNQMTRLLSKAVIK